MKKFEKLYFDTFIGLTEALEDYYKASEILNNAIGKIKKKQQDVEEIFVSTIGDEENDMGYRILSLEVSEKEIVSVTVNNGFFNVFKNNEATVSYPCNSVGLDNLLGLVRTEMLTFLEDYESL